MTSSARNAPVRQPRPANWQGVRCAEETWLRWAHAGPEYKRF